MAASENTMGLNRVAELFVNALDSSHISLLFALRMSGEQLVLSRQNDAGCSPVTEACV